MKDEDAPFHIQKVRLDAGTLIWSVIFLPIMGMIATEPKYNFLRERPLTWECGEIGTCHSGAFLAAPGLAAADAATADACRCGGGVHDLFVGCDGVQVYASLGLFVIYSWLTGVVVKQFSSIHRSIADGFSLMLLYFVLDPLVRGGNWDNWALNLVALIMPLSIITFSSFASESQQLMHKLFQAAMATEHGLASEEHTDDCEEDQSIGAAPSTASTTASSGRQRAPHSVGDVRKSARGDGRGDGCGSAFGAGVGDVCGEGTGFAGDPAVGATADTKLLEGRR